MAKASAKKIGKVIKVKPLGKAKGKMKKGC